MSKELKELNKEELLDLKKKINNRLKSIKTKEQKKDTLMDLKTNDKIFGIRLSMGGHRMVDPEVPHGEVDIIDYCVIEGNNLKWGKNGGSGDDDAFRLIISHKKEPFGVSTTLSKEEHGDKHYLLCIDTMFSGYDSFYTLKPERWKEDLKKAYKERMERVNRYHQSNLDKYKQKLDWFLEGEEMVNEHII